MELCTAKLLAQLISTTAVDLAVPSSNLFAWCDSTAVLGWPRNPLPKGSVFVRNRVFATTDLLLASKWHYVATDADLASRACIEAASLAAFRRFVNHQGLPHNVYSDNGRIFIGAQFKRQYYLFMLIYFFITPLYTYSFSYLLIFQLSYLFIYSFIYIILYWLETITTFFIICYSFFFYLFLYLYLNSYFCTHLFTCSFTYLHILFYLFIYLFINLFILLTYYLYPLM